MNARWLLPLVVLAAACPPSTDGPDRLLERPYSVCVVNEAGSEYVWIDTVYMLPRGVGTYGSDTMVTGDRDIPDGGYAAYRARWAGYWNITTICLLGAGKPQPWISVEDVPVCEDRVAVVRLVPDGDGLKLEWKQIPIDELPDQGEPIWPL